MGMFDAKLWLTGDQDAVAAPGDVFILKSAEIDGTVRINGEDLPEAKLLVEMGGEDIECYTSGRGIVNQIKQKSAKDMFPVKVRIVEKSTGKGNPMRLLEKVEA